MELSRRGLGIHLTVHPVIAVVATPGGSSTSSTGTIRRRGRTPSRSSTSRSTGRPAPRLDELGRDLRRVLGEVRAAVEDWPPCASACASAVADARDGRRRRRPDEVAEARALLAWLGRRPLHVPRLPRVRARTDDGEDTLRAVAGSGLGHAARSGSRRSRTASPSCRPRCARWRREPDLLILTKANARVDRPPARVPGLRRRQALRRRGQRGRRAPLPRPLHDARLPRERRASIPVLRRKVQARARARRLPARQPRRQGARRDPRDVSRATSCSRSTTTSSTRSRSASSSSASASACGCSCARDRTGASSRAWCTSRAIASTPPTAQRIERDPARGARRRERRLDAAADRVGARAHPLHVRTDRRRARRRTTSRELEARIVEATRSWDDDLDDALVEELGEERGDRRSRAATARRSRPPTATTCSRARRVADIAAHRGARRPTATRPEPVPAAGGAAGHAALQALPARRAPISLSDVLPMFENMGLHVTDERPYEVTPARAPRRCGSTTSGCDYGDGATLDADRIRERFHEAFARVWRGDAENDGFNRLVLAAGLDWREVTIAARGRDATCARPAARSADATWRTTLPRHPAIARALVELFQRALRSRAADDRGGAEHAVARDRGGASTPSTSLDEDRILRGFLARRAGDAAHELLPARRGRRAEAVPVVQARPGADPDLPAAAADVRDLRLLAAGRGRAPARRDGRARRPALVGPPRGLPHRGPRPDEGADGQERGDRAGRREGRLRRQAPAAGDATRCAPRSSPATDVHPRAARPHRQPRRRARSSRPRDVVRHDGDDPYLVVAADKGTATFSDIANAISPEYGFWLGDAFASGGSAGYDHKAMGITARGAWESVQRHFRELGVDVQTDGLHRRRHRRHVGRRVRQRDAALAAHPARRRRSTTATSSSTPIPTRRRSFAERQRLFDAAALVAGPTTTRR